MLQYAISLPNGACPKGSRSCIGRTHARNGGLHTVCPAGTYSLPGSSSCTACPSGSTSSAGASSCTCTPGFAVSGSGASLSCTGTARCSAGSSAPATPCSNAPLRARRSTLNQPAWPERTARLERRAWVRAPSQRCSGVGPAPPPFAHVPLTAPRFLSFPRQRAPRAPSARPTPASARPARPTARAAAARPRASATPATRPLASAHRSSAPVRAA